MTEAGQTARAEYCFDAANGFLKRRRLLKDTSPPVQQGLTDVLEVFNRDDLGNRDVERYFGGDSGPTIPTDIDLCALSPPSSFDYRIEHAFQYGAPRKSFYTTNGGAEPGGTSIGFNLYDADIDFSTGLPMRTRDTSGQIPTDYEYDAMGRLTAELPAESPQQRADTEYLYTNASWNGTTFTPATVTIEKISSGGALLAQSEVEFDDQGRLAAERRLMPDGTESERRHTYNARGWRLTSSEWSPGCSPPCGVTTFSSYDPFGRPGLITAPDQKTTSFAYSGVSRVERTVNIGGAGYVTTREQYDRFGRLHAVQEPAGLNNRFVYTYDEGDRLVMVASPNQTPNQVRAFDYDGRGFLLSEDHPELEGPVVYSSYDARGHAGQREQRNSVGNAFQRLTFGYDKAERLLAVSDALAGRPLKAFDYDDPSPSVDPRLDGRLYQATRHNWLNMPWDGTGQEVDIQIRETYLYGGPGGAVSQRKTLEAPESITFVTNWTYDQLGNGLSAVYPDCQGGTTCPSPVEPARTVFTNYFRGFLTSVVGSAGGQSWRYAHQITYHPNGVWNEIERGSSPSGESPVKDVQHLAPNGMQRPHRLRISGGVGGAGNFDTGIYSYDTAGNVTAMGTDTFTYDDRGRLATANVHGYSQSFTYDFYGNLVSYVTTPPGGGPATTTISTNSATNRLSGSTPTAAYDPAGNLTMLAGNTYKYDALNMEVQRNFAGDPQWTNVYTADDERFWVLVNTGGGPPPGEGFGNAQQVIYVRDLGGKVLRTFRKVHSQVPPDPQQRWTWGRDYIWREGSLLATQFASTENHHHLDHLGSMRQNTTPLGTILASPDYLPYGEGAPFSFTALAFQFAGYERELHGVGEMDNLEYLHARYRSPVYARFLRVDPIGGNPRAPQSWNRYSYVLDNPLKYTDPNGLVPCGEKKDLDCEAAFAEAITVTAAAPANEVRSTDLTGFVEFVGQGNSASSLGGGGSSGPRLVTRLPSNATLSAQAAAGSEFAMTLLGQEVPGLVSAAGPVELGILLATGGISSSLARSAAGDLALASAAPKITFGHGARHLIGTGLRKEAVEGEIARVVSAQVGKASATGSFSGRTVIGGRIIEYRAYTLPNGTINIGTFYPVP